MTDIKKKNKQIVDFLQKHVLACFVVVLSGFIGLIVLSNHLRREVAQEQVLPPRVTSVQIYNPSQAYLTTQAKVVDEGVVEIVVQNASGGVVQRVNVSEGQKVYRGQQLVSLSNNYQGANVSALQLELAEKNWLMTHANFWDQEKVDDINNELNANTGWVTWWETNPGRSLMGNGDAYTAYQGQQNLELLQLSDTMTQRGQQLSLDQAESNYFQAQIAASLMYPATPIAGTVEKVNVSVGQVVNPGQVVAVVKATKGTTKLELAVSENVLRRLAVTQPAWWEYQHQSYPVSLDYLPTTPTTGNSYNLSFTLDKEWADILANGSYVTLRLPLMTGGDGLLVPLNAIYQTQTGSYAYVVASNQEGQDIARQVSVVLGPVVGDLVTVESGLSATDRIIVNNDMLDGQLITVATSAQASASAGWNQARLMVE